MSDDEDKEELDRKLMPPPSITTNPPQRTTAAITSTNPAPPPKKQDNNNPLNQFPMLGGPQRAASGVGVARQKKPLAPGHSPLDWAQLKQSSANLAGVSQLKRYTAEEIKAHNKKDDLWMAYNGKVYNVTSYINYHPGGVGQLMRGAGKDATELINKIHPWVNIDMMLDKCCVGFYHRDSL